MAQARESSLNTSSPQSSSGAADSFKGTPDTGLTAFSQEEDGSKFPGTRPILTLSKPGSLSHRVPLDLRTTVSHDHFVNGIVGNSQQKLSPTASSFQPVFLPALNIIQPPGLYSTSTVYQKLSNELGLSRYIAVNAKNRRVTANDLESALDKLNRIGIPRHGKCQPHMNLENAYLRFTDVRDSYIAFNNTRLSPGELEFYFAWPSNQLGQNASDLAYRTAQVHVMASSARPGQTDFVGILNVVQPVLQAHGQLFAFIRTTAFDESPMRAVAEFCNADSAVAVEVACRHGITVDGVHISITSGAPEPRVSMPSPLVDRVCRHGYGADLSARFQNLNLSGQQPSSPGHAHMMSSAFSGVELQVPSLALPYTYGNHHIPLESSCSVDRGLGEHGGVCSRHHSLVGTSLLHHSVSMPLHDEFSSSKSVLNLARAEARRQHAARVARSLYHGHNHSIHHNHVDIGRIREGTDVRTTIMLRNIPNKVDQAMLKRMVDESSWGKYDFMYLRIDFANDCNVGYAFINFVDPLDIIDFVNARGNQRWNCFKSDKVAEISYATIQGKDCLVQKFRNSSVMLEAPHYRPKLYYTSNGPFPELAGHEEPFPDPDNQSKMKRSCENAEHVGLFTPNAGQHFRDEQRRRRSQYDRGTRLAALEEYDYEAAYQTTHVGH